MTSFLFAAIAIIGSAAPREHGRKRVVAFFDSASRFGNLPYTASKVPYYKLTHIIHNGVPFDASGRLQITDEFVDPELIQRSHQAGVKIMLLIRGEFQAIEGKPERLQLLLGDVKQFVMESGYDGVDVDWEYPSSAEDTALLLALMKGLRSVLPQPYLLSVDAAPFMESAYDVRHVREFVDFFNVMTYDCAGPWTAYAQLNSKIFPTEGDPKNSDSKECEIGGSDKEAADIFLADAPAEKLNQGTAFFGFEYKSVRHLYEKCPSSALTADHECDEPAVPVLKYGRDIKPLLDRAGWKVLMDDTAHVPYLVRTDGSPGLITYDDPSSTYERAWYSDWDRGLGGMFVWKLDEDYDGQSQDLLDAVYRASFRVAVTGRPDPVYQSRSGWKRLGDGNGENGHCFDYSSQP